MCGINFFNYWVSSIKEDVAKWVIIFSFMVVMTSTNSYCALVNPNALDLARPNCTMAVSKCEPLLNPVCLGTTLSYQFTSSALVLDTVVKTDAGRNLQLWRGLQNVPKCWEVVQPLICAIYLPKCVTDNATNISRVQLPARELCEKIREPCRIVDKYKGWPDFLKCDYAVYVAGCTNDVMTARFNTTGNCEPPLVATTNAKSWYPDIDGCGIQCQNPIYTDREHVHVHTFVAILGSICLACTLFTIVTFLLEWKVMSRYPGVIVFFINSCFFIGSVGWMAQFIPKARKDIVCRADGTMRKAEPTIGSGENSTCTIVFIVIYYFMMAGVTWFVILTYALNLTYGSLGSTRDVLEGRRGHFHLVAWSFPLVLTIVCLALSQVDGDSLSGICFVGFVADAYRSGFVLLPIGLSVVIGLTFLIKGLIMLVRIRTQSPGLINEEASARIRDTIIRLGFFALFILSFTVITFGIHTYIFLNEADWQSSLDEYIACKSNITSYALLSSVTPETCIMKSRPNVVSAQIHIFAYFAAGIIMSSWVWNWTTVKSWKRNLKKLFCLTEAVDANANPVDHPKKSDLMPNLFVIQKEVNYTRQSSSFNSNREDPLAMNLDLTSVTSRELSSSWAPAVQRMMLCRSGIHSAGGRQRRFSDSDVQSISSLFEHLVMHDSHSKQGHLRSSHDTSHNDSTSVLHASTHTTASAKPKRHGHQKKNRVVPAVDSNNADQQVQRVGKMNLGSPALEYHAVPPGTESLGYASSLAGCSSIACGSSFSGGSSLAARSSTAGVSSITGRSSVACGTSNSFQGSDGHPESPTSRSEESRVEDGNGGEDAVEHCQDPADEATQNDRTKPQKDLSQTSAEGFGEDMDEEQSDEIDEEEFDEDVEKEKTSISRSPSNFTVASSDTEALSIKLDNDYQPLEPPLCDPPQLKAVPPSTNVIKVSPIKPIAALLRKQFYNPLTSDMTNVAPNSKPTLPSQTAHNSTQTSSFLPPFANMGFHSPYSLFNYGPPYMPPMFCIPNAETPIWPPHFGFPAYFYPPYFEPRPYFPFPPSYYSHFTPPPAPFDLVNPVQLNEDRTEVMAEGQGASSGPPSHHGASQQTGSSRGSCANPKPAGNTSSTAFHLTAGGKSRDYGCNERCSKSLLEMVELMTPQLDSGTEPTDSDSIPKQYEIDEKREERRKSKRRQRHRWLKTLTVDNSNDYSDTSV